VAPNDRATGLEKRITELNVGLFNAREQLANARNELLRRDAQLAQAEAQKREETDQLSKAPQLWVDYKPAGAGVDPADWEALVFSNGGNVPIRDIQIGPLVWTVEEKRFINLHSVIGPLRGQPIECKFSAYEQVGTSQAQGPLPGHLREMMRKWGHEAQPHVEIVYGDFDGNWFCRAFVLSIDPFDRIVWGPGPVQLAKHPQPIYP
jgi:hypothetical protein